THALCTQTRGLLQAGLHSLLFPQAADKRAAAPNDATIVNRRAVDARTGAHRKGPLGIPQAPGVRLAPSPTDEDRDLALDDRAPSRDARKWGGRSFRLIEQLLDAWIAVDRL